ncbi:Protein translocase subunit SecD [Candidatus Profftia lariciata]|uniref:protein translocase subunit SecD n=1 Tax=Candidatus Profftia lariciata TaxID=1987921 RepID=UPI001D01EEF1|nr:protein translocase subunit SecD [Candidatus Profftia lariciata]UDG81790.1 Protein translocase subunit SecD [Candidatus Profftia lariciata]
MLNCYPLWKYILLILVFFLGLLYALPNLYGENPALQIASINNSVITDKTILIKIRDELKKNNIVSKSIKLENNTITALFKNTDIQLQARETLINIFRNNYIIALNLKPATPKWLRKIGAEPMKLGLDLRGGVYFLMQIDMNNVLEKLRQQVIDSLRYNLYKNNITNFTINKIKKTTDKIEIIFSDTNTRNQSKKYLSSFYSNVIFSNINDHSLKIIITNNSQQKEYEYAVQHNINILRHRVNQLGIAEPLVHRYGTDSIVVELPGIQDTVLAKEILGTTATLEFHLVNTHINNTVNINDNNHLSEDSEIKYTRNNIPIILYKNIILTGTHIISSNVNRDEFNRPQIQIALDNFGGNIMTNFTNHNLGNVMATLFVEYQNTGIKDVNGKYILTKREEVINLATIKSPLGNTFCITGMKDFNEAHHLSLLLRAGTLSAPMQIIEERIIGPILGMHNIIQGLKSCLWAVISSIIFMIIWYRKFGFIAITALIINLILIVSIMSLLPGVTLTMPGIAGIVLTLSIAVDANVLINERIKEEIKNGYSIQRSLHKGYQYAFYSIADANCTTLITAIILYIIGTGSIQGFAITTVIGIATSMFTSIFCTRAIVNLIYGGKQIKKISI